MDVFFRFCRADNPVALAPSGGTRVCLLPSRGRLRGRPLLPDPLFFGRLLAPFPNVSRLSVLVLLQDRGAAAVLPLLARSRQTGPAFFVSACRPWQYSTVVPARHSLPPRHMASPATVTATTTRFHAGCPQRRRHGLRSAMPSPSARVLCSTTAAAAASPCTYIPGTS